MRLRYGRVHMTSLGPMFPGVGRLERVQIIRNSPEHILNRAAKAKKSWLKRFFDARGLHSSLWSASATVS